MLLKVRNEVFPFQPKRILAVSGYVYFFHGLFRRLGRGPLSDFLAFAHFFLR